MAGEALGTPERLARRLRPQAAHRQPGDDQLMGGSRRRRQRCRVKFGQLPFGLRQAADQQEMPDLEMPRMRGIDRFAVRFERRPGRKQGLRRPVQLARHQRDLGLGDDASGACHGLARREPPHRAFEQRLGARQITELSHGNAAQRQGGRVVAQCDPLQGAERIADRQRPRRRRDQRIHRTRIARLTRALSPLAVTAGRVASSCEGQI